MTGSGIRKVKHSVLFYPMNGMTATRRYFKSYFKFAVASPAGVEPYTFKVIQYTTDLSTLQPNKTK
jgi:hypothetical protein